MLSEIQCILKSNTQPLQKTISSLEREIFSKTSIHRNHLFIEKAFMEFPMETMYCAKVDIKISQIEILPLKSTQCRGELHTPYE